MNFYPYFPYFLADLDEIGTGWLRVMPLSSGESNADSLIESHALHNDENEKVSNNSYIFFFPSTWITYGTGNIRKKW